MWTASLLVLATERAALRILASVFPWVLLTHVVMPVLLPDVGFGGYRGTARREPV